MHLDSSSQDSGLRTQDSSQSTVSSRASFSSGMLVAGLQSRLMAAPPSTKGPTKNFLSMLPIWPMCEPDQATPVAHVQGGHHDTGGLETGHHIGQKLSPNGLPLLDTSMLSGGLDMLAR